MRRKEDSYLNATQILKVAGIDKGRRTKVLEKEIIQGEHEKVQGGYGKYQGTWYVVQATDSTRIPFERGLQLATQFQVEGFLAPILNFVPPSPGKEDSTPSKEQALAAHRDPSRVLSAVTGRRKANADGKSPEKKSRKKASLAPMQNMEMHEGDHFVYPHMISQGVVKRQRVDHTTGQSFSTQGSVLSESRGERHRATLMAMFLNDDPLSIPEILISPHSPPDLDVNIVIDDQGHSALHWAAALARIDILRLLITKGGDVLRVNFNNESALIRSVLVTNNFDSQTFPELLSLLAPSAQILDMSRRSVLHHIALVCFIEILHLDCRK